MLAYHYLTALGLDSAVGKSENGELEAQAVRYLGLAGERALGLDVEPAEHNLARALDLPAAATPSGPACSNTGRRPLAQQGRLREAQDALQQALARHREQGDSSPPGAA